MMIAGKTIKYVSVSGIAAGFSMLIIEEPVFFKNHTNSEEGKTHWLNEQTSKKY